jgi:hypothetical protein
VRSRLSFVYAVTEIEHTLATDLMLFCRGGLWTTMVALSTRYQQVND